MNGNTLRQAFQLFCSSSVIETLAAALGVVERDRKRELYTLVWSLLVAGGSDDSGRLADVYSTYLSEAEHAVVRGSFYAWFTTQFASLMAALTQQALGRVRAMEPHLPGRLGGVRDWILVDSETVTLPDALLGTYPSTSERAGLKVHKWFSVGRNNIIDFRITPAREHDGPHLRVDENWRGFGLIADLGYVSHDLLRDCQRHGVALVVRLKDGWKPQLVGVANDDGRITAVDETITLEGLIKAAPSDFERRPVDLDVCCGRGRNSIAVRLVGVPGDEKYHWCLTTLPRETHSAEAVCELYRIRWEVECDMKRDKAAGRLDQIRATTVSSVMALVHGSLLHTILVNHIVYEDLRTKKATEPPVHGLALGLAMKGLGPLLLLALQLDDPARWEKVARALRHRAEDPNWRARPSHLDRLRGSVASPGRPRRGKLADCPVDAAPHRRAAA